MIIVKLQLRRKTEEDSVARDKCYSCALPEEKAVPGIKAGRLVSTISLVHRTNTWEKKQWGKVMLLLKRQVLVDSSPTAPQSLLRSEEVVQDSRENPPFHLKNKITYWLIVL